MAERVGFEPTDPRGSTVFKTVAFDHSATSPEVFSIERFEGAQDTGIAPLCATTKSGFIDES